MSEVFAFRSFRYLRNSAGRVLFPPSCSVCGDELPECEIGRAFCPECLGKIVVEQGSVCGRCAMPCPDFEASLGHCVHCREAKLRFDTALTLGPYDGMLRQIVLKLKHAEFEPLAHQMGSLLTDRVRTVTAQQPIDLVTCVPMHWLKRWMRGSSAPEVLARRVASDLRLPCYRDLLRCRRLLKKQSSLTMPQRWLNVRGGYRVAWGFDIREASVLVIDDVLTSGATANEVAKALRLAGAKRVTLAAIARGTGELT